MHYQFENEENNLQNSINKLDVPSESSSPFLIPIEAIDMQTINDKGNFFDNNIFMNDDNFYKNFTFKYNNSICEENNKDNLKNSLNKISNKNSNEDTRNNNNENIEKSEPKLDISKNLIKNDVQGNSIPSTSYEEKKQKNALFKTKRVRGKRKSKNKKIRRFNIRLKFRSIIIDSFLKYINEKIQIFGLRFEKLDYENTKRKKYEELKDKKLREILENASRKNNKNPDCNKETIQKIDKLENSELKSILELKLFDVYYNILIKENDILKGLNKKFKSLKEEKLKNKSENYINGFKEAKDFYKKNI